MDPCSYPIESWDLNATSAQATLDAGNFLMRS